MTLRAKVQQQLYTRERGGIFRSNEGFDTVAKSSGLDNSFIKSVLHPFCVYKIPQEFLKSGETNSTLFPESVASFHAPNGDMVIGRSIYVEADFTGQRSTSFTHNFVIPKEIKGELLRSPASLFHIQDFRSTYDIQQGKQLDELDVEVFLSEGHSFTYDEELMRQLGLDETMYKQLLLAMMGSVTNKKKVYISLNVPITELPKYASRLMEVMYQSLPHGIREQLGFMTYNSEPEGKQGIHVMFVEQDSIRPNDRNTEKDYIFDFPNRRFMNVELSQGTEHIYLDYAWKYRDEPDALVDFFAFCEQALLDIPAGSIQPTHYYQLCHLYQIEQGNTAMYESNRAGVLNWILAYLKKENVGAKPRLNRLFVEQLMHEHIPNRDFLKEVVHYCLISNFDIEQLMMVLAKLISRQFNHQLSVEESLPVFDQLEKNSPDMLHSLIHKLYELNSSCMEEYVLVRMDRVTSLQKWADEINFWTNQGNVIMTRFIMDQTLKRVIHLLDPDSSKRILQAKEVCSNMREFSNGHGRRYDSFADFIISGVFVYFVNALSLKDISMKDWEVLDFVFPYSDAEYTKQLDETGKENLSVLTAVHNVLSYEVDRPSIAYDSLEKLSISQQKRAHELLKKLLPLSIQKGQYELIPFAFYVPERDYNHANSSEFEYLDMLKYVASQTSGSDRLYDFIVWSTIDKRFDKVDYLKALDRYFTENDSQAFKKETVRKKLLNIRKVGRDFYKLFEGIMLSQHSGLYRFWYRNKKKIVRLTALSLLGLVVIIGSLLTVNYFFPSLFGSPAVTQEEQ
jgi:hypothetical protein